MISILPPPPHYFQYMKSPTKGLRTRSFSCQSYAITTTQANLLLFCVPDASNGNFQ